MLAHVIRQALEQWQAQAGTLLELTVRQIRRIMTRVRHEGDRRLVNRGRLQSSNRRMPTRVKSKSSTSTQHYGDFWLALAAEKLAERHRVTLGAGT
jgi:hypothetical protein